MRLLFHARRFYKTWTGRKHKAFTKYEKRWSEASKEGKENPMTAEAQLLKVAQSSDQLSRGYLSRAKALVEIPERWSVRRSTARSSEQFVTPRLDISGCAMKQLFQSQNQMSTPFMQPSPRTSLLATSNCGGQKGKDWPEEGPHQGDPGERWIDR